MELTTARRPAVTNKKALANRSGDRSRVPRVPSALIEVASRCCEVALQGTLTAKVVEHKAGRAQTCGSLATGTAATRRRYRLHLTLADLASGER
jgi:hypothetical protein